MIRQSVKRLVHAIRRFNRTWLDRLDPDFDPRAAPSPPPPPEAPPARPRRAVTVYTEPTPNPEAMKFVCSVEVGSLSFASAEAAAGHPIGRALFAVEGVQSVFGVTNFVTVTRRPDADWSALIDAVEDTLEEALSH